MNKVLIFFILLSFILCQPSEVKREERRRKQKEDDRQLAECILNNSQISPMLKNLIEENKDKDENLLKFILHMEHKLDQSDNDIIRNCRIELINKKTEERRQQEKRENLNRDDL